MEFKTCFTLCSYCEQKEQETKFRPILHNFPWDARIFEDIKIELDSKCEIDCREWRKNEEK